MGTVIPEAWSSDSSKPATGVSVSVVLMILWVSRILLADGISTAFGENNDFGASLSKAAFSRAIAPKNKMGPLDPKHKALPKLRRMVNQQ
jgi:hypothetical protein